MKNKVKWLCALLACLLIGTTAAACGNDDHPEYSFPEYGYTNPGETAVDTDEEVTLDGNLDESFWSEKRWFDSYLESRPDVTLRVTSHFGEKGVYFAFDVNDPEVYAVPERFTWYNSAVELYVSTADGADNLANGDAYEADVDASGRTSIRKWSRQGVGAYGFNNWPTEIYGETVTKNGAVNTAECTGYTVEMFIPWEGLGGEKQEFLYVNPTLIRTSSANPVDQDRIWYNFGMEERGAAWGSAGTWWVFDENGLDALDVTTSVSGAGSLNARSYVVAGDDYTFMIEPEAGNYLKSLVINGVDVTDNIRHNYAAGTASYTATNVSDALSIEAEFTPFAASRTVTGTVTADVPLPNNNFALSRLYAVKNGSITAIPVAADGTFTAQLPAEEMRIVGTADGYFVSETTVTADAQTAAIALTASNFGNNAKVEFTGYSAANWNFERYLTEGSIVSNSTDIHNTVLRTDVFGGEIVASGRIVLPQANRDVRMGFTFYNPLGDNVFFALLWDVESGQNTYSMQTITRYNNNDHWENTSASVPTGACYDLLRTDGLPFAVRFKDGTFTVYINGTAVLSDYTVRYGDGGNMFGSRLAGVGLTTWSYAGEFYDVEITGENVPYPEAAIVPESNVTGAGEVTFDKAAYASGDTVTVTFTPGEGMQVSEVYVNGINRFGLVSGNTLVLENFTEDFLVVRAEFVRAAEGTGTYTGTVSGYRNGATNVLEGAEVRLKDADAFDESVNVGADGTFSFADVPFGNYVLTVNMPGYSEYSEKVSFSGDMTSDVTLAWDFANIVSGSADLSGMNDENHAIGINAWGSMVQLTLDDGMAAGDTVAVKVNIRANRATGNWGDNFGVILAEKDGTYYGLSFLFENLSNPSGNAQLKQQWTDATVNAYLPAWVGEAILGGGLDTLFVRNGTTIDVFALHNGVWTYLASTSVPGDAVTDVRFQQWGDSVYSGIEWTGDISIDPTVTTGENGDAAFTPVSYGEDLAITLTPDEGYMIGSVTINGVPFDELEGVSIADNVLTLSGWRIVGTVIDVAFVPEETADAEIAVTLIKGTDSAAIADGTEVRLVGLNEYVTEAAGGKVTFSDILTGEYALVIDGYETAVVNVSGEAIDPVTLKYDWVRLTTDVDNNTISSITADVNLNSEEASISWTGSVSEMIWLNVEDSEYFSFEATAHYPDLTAGTVTRFMLFAMRFNGNGANGIISFELETQNNQFQLFRHWVWGYDQGFRGVNSTAAQVNALRDGTFRYRVIREGDLLSIYVYDGTAWSAVHTDLSLSATYGESGTAYIGVGQQWVGVSSISGISYTTEDITAVNVVERPAENGTYTVSAGDIGGALTVTATAAADYYVEKITVSGVEYTDFTDGENGARVLTIDSFNAPEADVTVTFTSQTRTDVSFAVNYRRGSETGVVADGTAYTLTGPEELSGEITDGGVAETSVLYGTYTLSVTGYDPVTVTIGAEPVTAVTVEFNWLVGVTNSDNITQTSMYASWSDDNGLAASWTTSVNEMLWLDMEADTSFSFEAVLSWPGYSAGSGARYTPFAIRFGSEKNNIVAIDIESEGAARMQLYRRWDSWPYAMYLTEDETTALKNGTLRFRVVRDSATLYVYLGTGLTDTSWRLLITGDLSQWGDVTGKIGIGQLWVGACSISGIQYDGSADYKNFDVTIAPAENGEIDVTGSAIGDNVVVTATPAEGYYVSSITVNGTVYSEFTAGEHAVRTVTLNGYTASPELVVSAQFASAATADISFRVNYVKGADSSALPDGTPYTLTGPVELSGQIADGRVVEEDVLYGTYTLTVEGYGSVRITVGADPVADVNFVYDWVRLTTDVDNNGRDNYVATVDSAAGSVSWSGSTGEMIWFNEENAENFAFEATASYPRLNIGVDARVILFAMRFGDTTGDVVSFQYETAGNTFQMVRHWEQFPSVGATADQVYALQKGLFRIRAVRSGDTMRIYGYDGANWAKLFDFSLQDTYGKSGAADVGVGQLNAGACSITGITYNTEGDYNAVTVTETPAENGTYTVNFGDKVLGSDLVVTATPDTGYFVEKITVSGVDYNTFTDGENGAKVLTLSSYTAAPEVTVSVTFTEIELGDVDITLYGHYGTDTTLFAEGTAYTLTGPAQQSGQVAAGGKVTLEGIQAGTYALTVEGYEPYTFELTADGYTNEVTLEYDWVRYATDADSTVIDGTTAVVDMNSDNPTVSWSGTANEVLWLNFEDSETFSFEATVHYTGYTANQRLMLFAMRFDATILSFELATDSNNFQFFKHWDWDWQPGHGFIGYAATQEQMDALEAGTFRYRVVRSGDTIRIYIYDGANWSKRFDAGLSYTYGLSGAADVGFGTYNSGAVAFSGISYDASDSYNDLVVTEAPAENGEYTVAENGIGGDLVVTATPSSGYYVESITLNGIQYTGEQLTDGDGSDKVLTVSGYDELPEISVSVSFAAIVEVSINTAEVYGYRDGEHTLIPAGTPYTLTGPVSREGTLPAEGTLVEEGLIAGQYTLTIGDYFLPDGLNLQVPEFSTALVLWYDYAEELTGADFIDTAGMNDADHAIVFTDYGLLRLNIGDLADDKTVYVKTTIKVNEVAGRWSDNFGLVMASTDDTESGRYGLTILYGDLNNPSQDSYIKQQWAGQQNAAAGLPDWVATSLLGDGLDVIFVRNTTVIDLFAFDGTTWTKLASYTGIPEAATTDIIFGQWGASTYFNTEFSGDLSVDVNIGTFENGAVTANSPAYGGTLELTVAPEEGYALDTLTVNGIAYTELVASYGASFDGTVLSVPGWSNLYAEVSATFKETAATDVSFSLELHKYGIDDDNRIAIPDGTTVTLTGPNQYVLQAADGGISQAGMTNGEYTVSVDGYRSLTINVGGDALESSYTLEYDAVDQTRSAAVYDISAINDGTILLDTDNNRDVVYLNETVAAGEDFMITAVFKNPNLSAAEIRYGFIAAHDANGDGTYSVDGNDNLAAAEMVMPNILYQKSAWSLQFCETWQGVAFDSTMLTKFSGDDITAAEGLTVGFARIGGRYYMYADNGGERLARWVSNSVYSSGIEDGALQLGFRTWQAGTGCEQYEILRGDAVSRALYPAGVYEITDSAREPKNTLDATVTWTEEEKSVVYGSGGVWEYVWLDLAPSDTFTFTANVEITNYVPDGNRRTTPFALMLGPNNNDIVVLDINNLNLQLIKLWDWNDFGQAALPESVYAADDSGGTYTVNMALKAEFSDGTLTISAGASQDDLAVLITKASFNGVTLHDNMRIGVGQNNGYAFSVTDITYTTTVA